MHTNKNRWPHVTKTAFPESEGRFYWYFITRTDSFCTAIFEHIMATTRHFDLEIFETPASSDKRQLGPAEKHYTFKYI
ncbi:MAG: hypothetical protein ABJ313_14110, partial [Cyclobacteriaceae bacterium]